MEKGREGQEKGEEGRKGGGTREEDSGKEQKEGRKKERDLGDVQGQFLRSPNGSNKKNQLYEIRRILSQFHENRFACTLLSCPLFHKQMECLIILNWIF